MSLYTITSWTTFLALVLGVCRPTVPGSRLLSHMNIFAVPVACPALK